MAWPPVPISISRSWSRTVGCTLFSLASDSSDVDRPARPLAPGHVFEAVDWHEVTVAGADLAMDMEITSRVVNGAGVLLGGMVASLVDMVAGSLLMRSAPPGTRYATRDLHIAFLAPARRGPVRAVARVLRQGRRGAVVRVEVNDRGEEDRPVASATLSFVTVDQSR